MTPKSPSADQLAQVYELNRLFLTFLQTCARQNIECPGLSEPLLDKLRSASGIRLDSVAEFPRALFELNVDNLARARATDPLVSAAESARRSVYLTVLLSAWSFSRNSVYQARFLLGLESRAIQRLRALSLTDLPDLARHPHLVACAFATSAWIWTELLTETRPEARRQLALVALQPGLAHEWPRRGAPSRSL